MTETLGTAVLRLWLAGVMHLGWTLVRVGPFLLSALGFGGWLAASRDTLSRPVRGTRDAPRAPGFTLR
jgi:hypothetical protein